MPKQILALFEFESIFKFEFQFKTVTSSHRHIHDPVPTCDSSIITIRWFTLIGFLLVEHSFGTDKDTYRSQNLRRERIIQKMRDNALADTNPIYVVEQGLGSIDRQPHSLRAIIV